MATTMGMMAPLFSCSEIKMVRCAGETCFPTLGVQATSQRVQKNTGVAIFLRFVHCGSVSSMGITCRLRQTRTCMPRPRSACSARSAISRLLEGGTVSPAIRL